MKCQVLVACSTSLLLLIVSISSEKPGEKQRFDNFKVYSVNVENVEQMNVLQKLEKQDYDFWESPMLGEVADVMISPEKATYFERLMDRYTIKRSIKVANVQE